MRVPIYAPLTTPAHNRRADPRSGEVMTSERRRQWTQRLDRLHDLINKHLQAGRYERAHRAWCVVQQVYDRWGTEMFMGHDSPRITASLTR